MTTETNYKNLPVPDAGQEDWDDEINNCFVIIDTSLKNVSEDSITKAAAQFDGITVTSSISGEDNVTISLGADDEFTATYNSTDNTTYLRDTATGDVLFALPHDGTTITTDRRIEHTTDGAYVTDSALNGDLTPSSVTAQSVNTVLNAAQFDGGNGGAMIQSAIDALPSSGGTVWVPTEGPDTNGRWTVSDHILLRSNVRLLSDGATLYLADGSHDNVIMTNETESDTVTEHITIEGFHIDGNKANNDRWERPSDGLSVNPACIYVLRSNVIRIRDCELHHSRGYGVKLARTTNATVESCIAHHMQDDGFTATDVRYSTAETEYCTFYNCYAEDNNLSGFEVDDGPQHIVFNDCSAYNNEQGFQVHTHDYSDTPASPQNIYHYNCVAINNAYGFMNGSHLLDDQAAGMFYYNIYASGSTESAFTAGGSSNSDDTPAYGLIVNGFKFEHEATANHAAIYLNAGSLVQNWKFKNGMVKSGHIGLTATPGVRGLTLDSVEFDMSTMTTSDSGIELNTGGTGTIRRVTLNNCIVHHANNSGVQLWNGGGTLENVHIIGGEYYNNGQNNTNSSGAAGISINDNGSAPSELSVMGVHCYDDQNTKTQVTGIWWDGVINSSFVANVLIGNANNATDGTLGNRGIDTANVT